MLGLKVRRMLLMGEEKHHVSLPSWSQGCQRIPAGHWSYTTGPFILNFIRQTAICFWGDESLSQSTKKLFLVHRIWESEGERERDLGRVNDGLHGSSNGRARGVNGGERGAAAAGSGSGDIGCEQGDLHTCFELGTRACRTQGRCSPTCWHPYSRAQSE